MLTKCRILPDSLFALLHTQYQLSPAKSNKMDLSNVVFIENKPKKKNRKGRKGKQEEKTSEKWNLVPPNAGEPQSKKVHGKVYHYCHQCKFWALHQPGKGKNCKSASSGMGELMQAFGNKQNSFQSSTWFDNGTGNGPAGTKHSSRSDPLTRTAFSPFSSSSIAATCNGTAAPSSFGDGFSKQSPFSCATNATSLGVGVGANSSSTNPFSFPAAPKASSPNQKFPFGGVSGASGSNSFASRTPAAYGSNMIAGTKPAASAANMASVGKQHQTPSSMFTFGSSFRSPGNDKELDLFAQATPTMNKAPTFQFGRARTAVWNDQQDKQPPSGPFVFGGSSGSPKPKQVDAFGGQPQPGSFTLGSSFRAPENEQKPGFFLQPTPTPNKANVPFGNPHIGNGSERLVNQPASGLFQPSTQPSTQPTPTAPAFGSGAQPINWHSSSPSLPPSPSNSSTSPQMVIQQTQPSPDAVPSFLFDHYPSRSVTPPTPMQVDPLTDALSCDTMFSAQITALELKRREMEQYLVQ